MALTRKEVLRMLRFRDDVTERDIDLILQYVDDQISGAPTGTVTVADEGTPIPGAPHSVLNFIGAVITATDAGGGVADITLAVSGDNLGNHTATQDLSMAGFNITNADTISTASGDLTLSPAVSVRLGSGTQSNPAIVIGAGTVGFYRTGSSVNFSGPQMGQDSPTATVSWSSTISPSTTLTQGTPNGIYQLVGGSGSFSASWPRIQLNNGTKAVLIAGGQDGDVVIQTEDATSINPGNISLLGGDGSGSGLGADITISTGNGDQSGNGGTLLLTTGDGGTATDGSGGPLNITLGSAQAGNAPGGGATITTGTGSGTGVGGFVLFDLGDGGVNSSGGDFTVNAGDAGGGSNQGGAISFTAGAGSGGGSAGDGGDITFTGGIGGATAAEGGYVILTGGLGGTTGGRIQLTGGAGDPTKVANGGVIELTGGAGSSGFGGGGGQIQITGGAGTVGNAGGGVVVRGGAGDGGNAGGDVQILSGAAGATSRSGDIDITAVASNINGTPGTITISGSDNTHAAGSGGNIFVNAGDAAGTVAGKVEINGGAGTAAGVDGGAINLRGGDGDLPGSGSFRGGDAAAGSGASGATVQITGGDGDGVGDGGIVSLVQGVPGASGNAGYIMLLAGQAADDIEIRARERVGTDYVGLRFPVSGGLAQTHTWIMPVDGEGAESNLGIDLGEFTVATLPAASSHKNCWALATDASGGRTSVRSDGTNWKVIAVEGATVTT